MSLSSLDANINGMSKQQLENEIKVSERRYLDLIEAAKRYASAKDTEESGNGEVHSGKVKGNVSIVVALGGYAKFLAEVLDNKEKAQSYYEKMVREARRRPPSKFDQRGYCMYLGSYANFLEEKLRNFDAAEDLYQQVLSIDAEDPLALGNYAILLHRVRKNYDEAERISESLDEEDNELSNMMDSFSF